MKHAIPHHAVLAGLIFCLAQSVAIAQWSSPGEFSDVKIQPSGTGQAQPFTLSRVAPNVNVPVLNNTGLEIKNPLGGIYLSLPAANGQPSTGGTFGVFKGVESMLYLQPGTSTNTLSIVANTSITGSLTVNGGVSFSGAGNFNIGGTGAITVTGNNTGVSATGSNAVAIGGSNGLASGEQSVVIGGGSQYGTNTAAGKNSMIIGSGQSVANSESSSVIGANGGKILGTGTQSQYSTIIGGSGNEMWATAGKYNVILGGGNNSFLSGGEQCAIVAGGSNTIDGGGYRQAIVGGYSNKIKNSVDSTIIGGSQHVVNDSPSWEGGNFVGGGKQNVVQPGASLCTVLGGGSNSANGRSNTVIGAANSSTAANTNFSTVMGQYSESTGSFQLVTGFANVADSTKLFIVGNGTSSTNRSNAFTVDTAGNATAKTSVTTPQLILTTPPDTSDISMGPFTQGAP